LSDYTNRLDLPYILASQAQKHVTHNEALRLLDGIVQARVVNATETSPPGGAAAGACYIVGSGATGLWAGWDGDIAMYADGSWFRLVAGDGWRVWDTSIDQLVVKSGGSWISFAVAMSLIEVGPAVDVAIGALGGATGVAVLEETLSGLSGASVNSTITIPDRAICLGVSTRTVVAITGATSFDCGISGQNSKFGGSLSVSAGGTNKGVIGPEAFYSATPVRLTANGGSFTGGTVRIAIHYLTVGLPS